MHSLPSNSFWNGVFKIMLTVAGHLIWYQLNSLCQQICTTEDANGVETFHQGWTSSIYCVWSSLCWRRVSGITWCSQQFLWWDNYKLSCGLQYFRRELWVDNENTATSGRISTNLFPQSCAVSTMVNTSESLRKTTASTGQIIVLKRSTWPTTVRTLEEGITIWQNGN